MYRRKFKKGAKQEALHKAQYTLRELGVENPPPKLDHCEDLITFIRTGSGSTYGKDEKSRVEWIRRIETQWKGKRVMIYEGTSRADVRGTVDYIYAMPPKSVKDAWQMIRETKDAFPEFGSGSKVPNPFMATVVWDEKTRTKYSWNRSRGIRVSWLKPAEN